MKIIDLLVGIEQKKYTSEFKFFVHISDLDYGFNSKENNINWTCKDGLIYNIDDACAKFYSFLERGIYKLSDEVELIENKPVLVFDEEDKEIEEIKKEMSKLQSEINLLSNEIGSYHNKIHSMRDRNNYMKETLKDLQKVVNELKKEGK